MSLDSNKEKAQKVRIARAERYACQGVARKALPKERVNLCLRALANKSVVDVWKHTKTNKAFYGNLIICGSVWNCPLCAAKISEKRRQELEWAFNIHKENGGRIAMLTLTFSHKKFDKLVDILDKFSEASKKFMSGRAFQNIRDEMGMIGRIRALEVTYSDRNGFHPHSHIVIFYEEEIDLKEMQGKMYDLWDKACQKVGLKASKKHGLKLEGAEEAQAYLSKHGTWSLEQEMTKAHIKKAKQENGLTPFDFLRVYLVEEDEKYLKLFKEYAKCFKGKRQLQWSQGLKKKFILEDKSDAELAQEKTEEADLLGSLEYEFWQKILYYEHRSDFLDLCETHSFEEAVDKLHSSIVRFENAMAAGRTQKKPSSSQELDPNTNVNTNIDTNVDTNVNEVII